MNQELVLESLLLKGVGFIAINVLKKNSPQRTQRLHKEHKIKFFIKNFKALKITVADKIESLENCNHRTLKEDFLRHTKNFFIKNSFFFSLCTALAAL